MSETRVAWSIELRSPEQQAEFDALREVLTDTLGLDWLGMAGEPDGAEVAADCAEALWAAGFRLVSAMRAAVASTFDPLAEPDTLNLPPEGMYRRGRQSALGAALAALPASPPHPQPPACGANEEKLK